MLEFPSCSSVTITISSESFSPCHPRLSEPPSPMHTVPGAVWCGGGVVVWCIVCRGRPASHRGTARLGSPAVAGSPAASGSPPLCRLRQWRRLGDSAAPDRSIAPVCHTRRPSAPGRVVYGPVCGRDRPTHRPVRPPGSSRRPVVSARPLRWWSPPVDGSRSSFANRW